MRSTATALFIAAAACGGTRTPPAPPPEPEAAAAPAEPTAALPKQLASFDQAWKAIKEHHWDPDKVGASWGAARDELRPKIIAATTDDEARQVIRQLLSRLGQSHFGLIPRSAAGAGGGEGGEADLGLDLRRVGDVWVVFRAPPKRPAATAGIKPGTLLRAVDGKPVGEILAPVADRSALVAFSLLSGTLSGKPGTSVTLAIDDGGGKKDVKLERTAPERRVASIGNVEIPVDYESRWLDRKKTIGYVRLTAFADPTMVSERFKADVKRFAKARGLVLDLRGNPGGLGGMAMGMAGLLSKEEAVLGTMITKDSKLKFVVNPQPGAYLGKVAVLIDQMCASTCEILAAGLADIGRATTFGTRTAGAALPSLIEPLPSGDLLQYATANYVLADGEALEGAGLAPMVEIELDPATLRAGKDGQLEAAIGWIKNGKVR
jgi:carboxyl-terminal processing protease